MEVGVIFEAFGCKWIVDRVYEISEEYAKQHDLLYRIRYSAHVIEAPEGYQGFRKVDAALR